MSQMGIRPPATFLDSLGNPAVDFRVYISQPFTDPKDPSKQLLITDSASGEVVSNPFTITPDGYSKNADGQRVNPIVQEQAYAILFESFAGGQQYSHQNVTGDAFGISAVTSEMVDRTINNFPLALSLDLTGSDFIFIQSIDEGWEGTPDGPVRSYYAYYTGGSGPIGTGTFDLFYDQAGNEWAISDISSIPIANEAEIGINAADISTNETAITTNESAIIANAAAIEKVTKHVRLNNSAANLGTLGTAIAGLGVTGLTIGQDYEFVLEVTIFPQLQTTQQVGLVGGILGDAADTLDAAQGLALSYPSYDFIYSEDGLERYNGPSIGTTIASDIGALPYRDDATTGAGGSVGWSLINEQPLGYNGAMQEAFLKFTGVVTATTTELYPSLVDQADTLRFNSSNRQYFSVTKIDLG